LVIKREATYCTVHPSFAGKIWEGKEQVPRGGGNHGKMGSAVRKEECAYIVYGRKETNNRGNPI